MLRSGDLPLSQLWPHLVLGLLAARRDGPPANPHLDELWRLVDKLDSPGMVAPPRPRSRRTPGSPAARTLGSTIRW